MHSNWRRPIDRHVTVTLVTTDLSVMSVYKQNSILAAWEEHSTTLTHVRTSILSTTTNDASLTSVRFAMRNKMSRYKSVLSFCTSIYTVSADADGPRDVASRLIDHISLQTELGTYARSVGRYWKQFAAQTDSCRLLAHACTARLTPLARFVVHILYKQVCNTYTSTTYRRALVKFFYI